MESSEDEYEEERNLGYIIDDYKVFMFLKNELVEEIYTAADSCRVQVEPFSDGETFGFMIEGTNRGIEKMKTKMNGFMEHLGEFQTDLEVLDAGYLLTDEGAHFVESIERSCHVQCEIQLSQDASGGAAVNRIPSKIWRLPDGQLVTILQDSLDTSDAKILIETFETFRTEDYRIQRKTDGIYVQFPVSPFRDKSTSPRQLIDHIVTVLDEIISSQMTSVAFTLERLNTWAIDVYVTAVISAFFNRAKSKNIATRSLKLCATDPNVYGRGCQVCDSLLMGKGSHFGAKVEQINDGKEPMNITVVEGCLNEMKADALVCTVADDLDLCRGAVSNALLDTAGDALQYELDKYYPDGLDPGKIAVTHGHCLRCKHVFYGVLYPYDDRFCEGYQGAEDYYRVSIHDFVKASMRTAEKLKVRSIAFPAVGSGNLDYPIELVVDQMFHSVESFQQDQGFCVKDVRFVVYPYDEDAVEAFKVRETEYVAAKKEKLYKRLVESRAKSDPTVVRITGMESDVDKAMKSFQDRIQSIYNLGRDQAPTASTSSQEPVSSDQRDASSTDSAVNLMGQQPSGISDPNLSRRQKEDSTKSVDNQAEQKAPVETTFDGREFMLPQTDDHSKQSRDKGHRAPLETTFDGGEVQEEDDPTYSVIQKPGRESNIAAAPFETTFDGGEVQKDDSTYSEIQKLGRESNIGAAPLETTFDGGEVQKEDDSTYSVIQKLGRESNIGAAPFETTFDGGEVPKEDDSIYSVIQKPDRESNIGAAPLETTFDGKERHSKSPKQERSNRYQAQDNAAGRRAPIVTNFDDEFEIPVTKPVTEMCKIAVSSERTMTLLEFFREELLSKFRNIGCDIMYEDRHVVLKGEPQFITVIKVELNSAINKLKELQSDSLDVSGVDEEEIHSVVGQFSDNGVLCLHNGDESEIEIYCLKYDKLQATKHAIEIKLGKQMVTRASDGDNYFKHKQGNNEDLELPAPEKAVENIRKVSECDDKRYSPETVNSPEVVNVPETENVGRESDSERQQGARPKSISRQFSWSTHAKDLQVFQTNEGLVVKVYSADILGLTVDCIVNAANDSLSHGGGVARAISKAAGKDLDKEGEKILKKQGKLKVGEVCSTNAGKLPYKCVIHAVGPCWDHYKPYTLEKVQQCEEDLHSAIINSLTEAGQQDLKTIAIPAVSSAKFGCPEDLCTVQYAKAVLNYSNHSKKSKSRLEEVHFVDKDIQIVKVIQAVFRTMIPDGHKPKFYEISHYVKDSGEGKHTLRKKDTHGKLKPSDISAPEGGVGSPGTSVRSAHNVTDSHRSNIDTPKTANTAKRSSSGNQKDLSHNVHTPTEGHSRKKSALGKADQSASGTRRKESHKAPLSQAATYKRSLSNQSNQSASSSAGPEQESNLVIYPYCTNTVPPGRTTEEFVCYISPKIKLYVYTDDLFSLTNIDMVACSDKVTGDGTGFLAQKLKEKGGEPYIKAKTIAFKRKKTELGDVVVCNGGLNMFKKVVHAILFLKKDTSGEEDRRLKVVQVFTAIFITSKKNDIRSLALPLLGTGKGNADPEYYAERFVESLYDFYPWNKDYVVDVHLVNIEANRTETAIRVIKKFVSKVARPLVGGGRTQGRRGRGAASGTGHSSSGLSSVGGRRGRRGGGAGAGSYGTLPARSSRPSTTSTEDSAPATFSATLPTRGRRGRGGTRDPGRSQDHAHRSSWKPEIDSSADDVTKEIHGSQKEQGVTSDDSAPTQLDPCVVCMDDIVDPKFLPCGHAFCTKCIEESFKHKKVCPTCGAICGIITGDQPDGSINVKYNKKKSLAGYESCGRIEVTYTFYSGTQGPKHPSPGKNFSGIMRTGFLPDNEQGRQISEMLQVAFDRKLVFTIGNSRTTGQEGVITWNDIHHKTDPNPDTEFGYPDLTYLDRITDELSAKGVTENDIQTLSMKRRH